MSEPDEIYDATTDEIEGDALAALPSTTTALALRQQSYTDDQLDLIKQTVARGTNDLEFRLFVEVCHLTGLNPFAHQIYAIMRNASEKGPDGKWRTVPRMTIQTGIDGYLAIASRTREFAGMDDVIFDTEEGEHPTWARVTVYRLVQGQRMPFTATARWREYVQLKDEYVSGKPTGKKVPTEMWARMGWTMLGKCVRTLALRLAFPAELGGVYTSEEMMQADNPLAQTVASVAPVAEAADRNEPPSAPLASKPAPKPGATTATTAKAPATSPSAASGAGPTAGLTTSDGCNPLADAALRKRMSALNIRSIADVETFLARVQREYTRYTRQAIEDELTALEARDAAPAADAHSLKGLAVAGAN